MPKWKQDETEFTVSVNYNEVRGYQSSIPKPIIDHLGDPKRITFVIDNKHVKILPATEKEFFKRELQQSLRALKTKKNEK